MTTGNIPAMMDEADPFSFIGAPANPGSLSTSGFNTINSVNDPDLNEILQYCKENKFHPKFFELEPQYESDLNSQDREAYLKAEETAKQTNLGLWADLKSIPPWEFRHKGKY
jgi:hypothetical protein